MARVTFQTGGGRLIDIVDSKYDVLNHYYVLKSDLNAMWNYLTEKKITQVTNKVARQLLEMGIIKEDKVPF